MTVSQPMKFLLVGAGGYFINLAVFALLLELGVPYLPDSIIAYFISNALMYLGNRYYTFQVGNEGFWSAYIRYILVGLVVAGLNAIVLGFLVEILRIYPVYAQAISLLIITPVAFVLNKRWTFGSQERGRLVPRSNGLSHRADEANRN